MKFIKNPFSLIFALLFVATTAYSQDKVSDTELTKFANAYTDIQLVNEKAQNEMTSLIENSGMEIATFNVLYQSSQNPNTPTPAEVSKEDTKKFEAVVVEIEKLQPKFQKEMEAAVIKNDMTIERYQQVVTQLQTDPELQQKLQQKLQ